MRLLARALSIVLHPAWMPTILLLLVFNLQPFFGMRLPFRSQLVVCGMVLCMTGLFPLVSTWTMARAGIVSSTLLPRRSDRIAPYLMALIYYAGAYYLLRRMPSHPLLWTFLFGFGLALVCTLLITLWWKISAHMVAIGALVATLLVLLLLRGPHTTTALAIALVAAGALGTARLLDSDHTPAQIYLGWLLGCACMLLCIRYGWYI